MTPNMNTPHDSNGYIMTDNKRHLVGDSFVAPVRFQVLKQLGHEDRIFLLCSPVDDTRRVVCLKDPFFIVCAEKGQDDELGEIPPEVIQRAADFISLGEDTPGNDGEDIDG